MSEQDRSISFSVIIPTKDRPEETLAAVRSVLGQSVPAKEIIVVDDGSAEVDRLTEELSSIEEVTLLVRGESGGPAVARNAGLARVEAGWVAFLDSDDRLDEQSPGVVPRGHLQAAARPSVWLARSWFGDGADARGSFVLGCRSQDNVA